MRSCSIVQCNQQRKDSLSGDQREALNQIDDWLQKPDDQVFQLKGPAGSGKSTLVVQHLNVPDDDVQYAAFTGKAASVLRQRGADNATTLHSLLYGQPTVKTGKGGNQQLTWHRRDNKIDAKLIVADECSMIDNKLGRDLLATKVKLLVTGDDYQVPPVSGSAFFNGKADFTLTEIHRQAVNSKPIQLATSIREGQRIKAQRFDLDVSSNADIAICAFERTRRHLNRIIRRGRCIRDHDPLVGDRVCAFQTNYRSGVLNGTLWTIQEVTETRNKARDSFGDTSHILDLYRLKLIDDIGTVVTVDAWQDPFFGSDPRKAQFEDHICVFAYGYALTCHKAQGSEWNNVVVIDETSSKGFDFIKGDLSLAEYTRRWLYTAVTRAKQAVTVMEPPP